MDDVMVNKAAAIERCLHRVREVYADDEHNLRNPRIDCAAWLDFATWPCTTTKR
jgi:hypothetical protein